MKIGILTFHDGPNHGAFLQAWSTLRILQSAGFDAEVINYKNPRHHQMEYGWTLRRFRNPISLYHSLIKEATFKKAQRLFRLGPLIKNSEELQRTHFDRVVIGSDVVWNYRLFGYDPAFFGRLHADRLVSFSASFGAVSSMDSHPQELMEDLSRFSAISVRDQNSQAIVREQLGKDATITVDPTLAYDFKNEIPSSVRKYHREFILIYSYIHTDESIRRIREQAAQKGLRIECVGYPPALRCLSYCDRINMSVNPYEWIRLVANAHTIVTSTFHGVVFSLKMKRPFWYLENAKAHNRVASLLENLGISHDLKLGTHGRLHEFDPDYYNISKKLHVLAERTKTWLINQLG